MAGRIDQKLVDEVLDGDPLLTPEEAAAMLGIGEAELKALPGVPFIQVAPDNGRSARRYRTSVITRLAARGIHR